MQVRIKPLTRRIDRSQPKPIEHGVEIGVHKPHTLHKRVTIAPARGSIDGTIKIVNHRKQLPHNSGDSRPTSLRNPLIRPLPVILKIRLSPKREILVLIPLRGNRPKLVNLALNNAFRVDQLTLTTGVVCQTTGGVR